MSRPAHAAAALGRCKSEPLGARSSPFGRTLDGRRRHRGKLYALPGVFDRDR